MTTEQAARVRAIAAMLKESATSVDDYLDNGCLFSEFELTDDQRDLLRAITQTSPRRRHENGQQSLFEGAQA